jgi:hypothetical protein
VAAASVGDAVTARAEHAIAVTRHRHITNIKLACRDAGIVANLIWIKAVQVRTVMM